jgi:hypothetical protein
MPPLFTIVAVLASVPYQIDTLPPQVDYYHLSDRLFSTTSVAYIGGRDFTDGFDYHFSLADVCNSLTLSAFAVPTWGNLQ